MGKQMNRCLILAASDCASLTAEQLYQNGDFVIAADNGIRTAQRLKIPVDLVVGDFDSFEGKLPEGIETLRFDSVKDDTDTMIAIKYALEHGCNEIVLTGVLGGRFDHTMATVQSMCYVKNRGAACRVIAPDAALWVLKNETMQFSPRKDCYIGVFSLNEHCTVTLKNLKYPLDRYDMTNEFPIGVSNEFLEEPAEITASGGNLLVVICPKNK